MNTQLATARSSVAVAVSGEALYAIGGWDGKNFLSSVGTPYVYLLY
jgi:hypothetical protein